MLGRKEMKQKVSQLGEKLAAKKKIVEKTSFGPFEQLSLGWWRGGMKDSASIYIVRSHGIPINGIITFVSYINILYEKCTNQIVDCVHQSDDIAMGCHDKYIKNIRKLNYT